MALTDDLLIILCSYSKGYRLMRGRIHGYSSGVRQVSSRFERASDATMRVTLSRLKQRGFVKNNKTGFWKITESGRAYLSRKLYFLPQHSKKTTKNYLKNMIVSFDIPEKHKYKRDWLRTELMHLGFEMLQKSVWFGPASLPDEFGESLRELNILPHLKFFEAKETDII